MPPPIQSRTRLQIRQSIGYNLQDMMLVTSSSTIDTSTLIASYSLAKGGDDEYNGRQVYAATMTGSIPAGEKSWVSDFAAATFDATVTPVFTQSITSGDIFEMWKVFTVEEVDDAINQAIMEVTGQCQQFKEISNVYSSASISEYDWLSSYQSLFKVEYVETIKIRHTLDKCETAWTAGSANVTVTADTSFKKEGNASVKAVEDGNSGAGAILAYKAISSTDITDSDQVEFWFYSSIALTAGQLQLKLDDTAAIASAVEALDIPAITANTWTRVIISLDNPQSDSAIISIGIYQVSDVGAFTFYIDDVDANLAGSKVWKTLNSEFWWISKGSTNYVHLTQSALSLIGQPTQMRLTGYQNPSLLSADGTASEIEPAFLIARVTGRLLITHAKSSRLDIRDRAELSKYWLGEAERIRPFIATPIANNTRSL